MKRLLSVLAISAVLLYVCLGAFACVPHCHGEDLDHSQHPTCPVHQFGLGAHDVAVESAAVLLLFLTLFAFVAGFSNVATPVPCPAAVRSRAPPRSFLY